MRNRITASLLFLSVVLLVSSLPAGEVPKAAWNRAIGEPFEKPLRGGPDAKIDDGPFQGLPIGGLGAGSIGRTYRGDFARWHLDVGEHYYQPAPANHFSVFIQPENAPSTASVLAVDSRLYDGNGASVGSSWKQRLPVNQQNRYYALFPKAWYVYNDLGQPGLSLTCEQYSPFIPQNYKESSYPLGIFHWTATNSSSRPVTVSLMFTWENMVGWFRNTAPRGDEFDDGPPYRMAWGQSEGNRNAYRSEGAMRGVVMSRGKGATPVAEEWDGEFVIATEAGEGVEVTYLTRFDVKGNGEDVWKPFSAGGRLPNSDDTSAAMRSQRLGAAVAVRFTLAPGASRTVPFVLAWDLPVMEFGPGAKWYKRYTAFFGTSGHNAWQIARDGLKNRQAWSSQIDAWQKPYLEDKRTPDWYKTALFNELYYLLDSGMAWENGRPGKPGTDYPPLGRVGYLECYEYRFYSTLDVNIYGSWAALRLFPELDKQEAKLFADSVKLEDGSKHPIGWLEQPGCRGPACPNWRVRKVKGSTPMDLGVPFEDPWMKTNFYTWQDANTLKDESPNLALKVWRDYVWTGKKDRAFLQHAWQPLRETIAYMKQFDTDADGIPNNDGSPDQTYDSWTMTGTSAYIGGLWIASLEAMAAIGDTLGDKPAAQEYRDWAGRARKAYESKLWNGEYYDFDTGSDDRKAIMADQLFGQFYAQVNGLPDVVPREHRARALKKIFDYNVMEYYKGEAGAVNGMMPNAMVDRLFKKSTNSHEVWTGVTYALAAFMLDAGLEREAWQTASGVYKTTYETGGMWFRTPEGWTDQPGSMIFRAPMYMRPLAIWAIQSVLDGKPK